MLAGTTDSFGAPEALPRLWLVRPNTYLENSEPNSILDRMVRLLTYLERLLMVVGSIFLATYWGFFVDQTLFSHVALDQFTLPSGAGPHHAASGLHHSLVRNVSQWSRQRIEAYERALTENTSSPIAVLRISRLGLQAPVLQGTDDIALNRGVGHIAGTVVPGELGNIGIAGHRDGFFRALKDVVVGDTVELQLHGRIDFYRVTKTSIVDPKDVSVLRSHSTPSLTLVTCYPFFFLGSAPKRFIVQATRVGSVSFPKLGERFSPGSPSTQALTSQVPESVEKMKEINQ